MSRNYIYKKINNFGRNEQSPVNDPISYCMPTNDNYFIHGPQSWKIIDNAKNCQAYLSEYCSQGWDGFCEVVSHNDKLNVVNNIDINSTYTNPNLTAGDILVRNTAARKYLVSMGMCAKKVVQFDPLVPSSPNVYFWVKDGTNIFNNSDCEPMFAVDPVDIDNDPVMMKILKKPIIAADILQNIFTNMKSDGSIAKLNGTRLGQYFTNNFNYVF